MSKSFVLRFLFWVAVLGTCSLQIEAPLARVLLPLFSYELSWLQDTFRIDRLDLGRDGTEQVIRVEVGLARELLMNGHVASPDPRGEAHATTLVTNITMPAVLLIATVISWPSRRLAACYWRGIGLVQALLILWMLDVPFVLWAGIWGLVVDAFDPGRFSPLLVWEHFLHSGGHLALAALLGAGLGAITSAAPTSISNGGDREVPSPKAG